MHCWKASGLLVGYPRLSDARWTLALSQLGQKLLGQTTMMLIQLLDEGQTLLPYSWSAA